MHHNWIKEKKEEGKDIIILIGASREEEEGGGVYRASGDENHRCNHLTDRESKEKRRIENKKIKGNQEKREGYWTLFGFSDGQYFRMMIYN